MLKTVLWMISGALDFVFSHFEAHTVLYCLSTILVNEQVH